MPSTAHFASIDFAPAALTASEATHGAAAVGPLAPLAHERITNDPSRVLAPPVDLKVAAAGRAA